MEVRIGQRNLICIAHEEENQRVIQTFLEGVTLSQISLVDIRVITFNERNIVLEYSSQTLGGPGVQSKR